MFECADIVVTYNRKKMLKENINALLFQTYERHDIIIVDNGSTDGTAELVKNFQDKRIKYFNTGKNLGGAGGFSYGVKLAIEHGYQYAWLMDDDSIPNKDALESLIYKSKNINNNFSFLASLVYWTDGKIFPMNAPNCNFNHVIEMQYDMIRRNKLIPINNCSFVGCFVNLNIASKVGLPISEFFIYGDDIEYTKRLRGINQAYLDLDSVIVHKAPSNSGADIVTADQSRISRFFYQSRNGMYIARKNRKIHERIIVVLKRARRVVLYSETHKILRLWMLLKGTFSGMFFNPEVEFADRSKVSNK